MAVSGCGMGSGDGEREIVELVGGEKNYWYVGPVLNVRARLLSG
jgi:hypothetical protein